MDASRSGSLRFLRQYCRSFLGAVIVLTPALLADQPDETLPGLKLTTPLAMGAIDNVNPYSGDPGVSVPLGPEYPLGPGNTFRLTALYSSKYWHFDGETCSDETRRHATVLGYPTLGIGWAVELGWVGTDANGFAYHSPTGRHDLASAGTLVWKTHDGSRLRVTATTNPTRYSVEFPDGTVHLLDHAYAPPRSTTGNSDDFSDWDHGVTPSTRYGLASVTDAFGTVLLTVTYVASTGNTAWQVDKINLANPARVIDYTWTTLAVQGGTGTSTWQVLQSVSFPTSAGTLKAVFSFLSPATSIVRSTYDNSQPAGAPCATVPAEVRVPFLTQIALQDDATPTPATLSTHAFEYGDTIAPIVHPGALVKVTLPTKGQITYDYSFAGGTCITGPLCADPETGVVGTGFEAPSAPPHAVLDHTPSLVTRTTFDKFTDVTSVVTYDRRNNIASTTDTLRTFRWVLITEPSGNGTGVFRTRHVYYVRSDGVGDTDGLEVATRFYGENNDGSGIPIRTIVSCYETDATTAPICGYRGAQGNINNYTDGANSRLQKEVTWYGVNPQGGGSCPGGAGTSKCKQSTSSTWVAAASRYQTTAVTTNLTSMAGWTGRTTTTLWNPQTGTGDWLLDVFTSTSATDSGSSLPTPSGVTSRFAFSLTDGFLSGIETLGGGGGSLSHFFVSTNGNPTQGSWVGKGPNMSGTFTDDQTFKSGLLTSAQRSGIGWKSADVDRADSTGLITASRDPNGLQTGYVYDRLGRVTSITPPGESAMSACYLPPINAYPWFVIVKKGASSACSKDDGAPATGSGSFEGYQYDGFGRVIREARSVPNTLSAGGYFARRETRYDAAGHVVFKSEWINCETPTTTIPDFLATDISICAAPMPAPADPGYSTVLSNFDPFGRARHVVGPDGTSMDYDFADGTIAHSDTLAKTTVHGVAGGDAISYIRRDVLGRVIEAQEPDVPTESSVKTSYKYNVFDKLGEVKQVGAGTTAGTTQIRSFAYDNYGFLKSETHPEKYDATDAGIVTTTYTPDALGNVKQRVDGGKTSSSPLAITYTYTYDAAGRLTQATAGGLKYLVTCYDGAVTCDGFATYGAPTGNKVKGQATFSVGYNFIPTVATVVTEEYKYESSSGRLTALTTSPGDLPIGGASPPPEPYKMTQTWSYNLLGLIQSYGHPRASGSFSETTEYKSGVPTKLTANGTDVVKAVTYNPAGGIATWTAGNTGTAIVTTITQDANYMPRPKGIRVQGGSTLFEIQDYLYDGAGNVTQMKYSATAKDDFTYDSRSRLTDADLVEGSRDFKYDRFGNLTQNGTLMFTMNTGRNQISSGSALYDSRGNLTTYASNEALWYDALNRQAREIKGTTVDQTYQYDATDERVLKTLSKFNVLRREMARYIAEANIIAKSWSLPACNGGSPSPFNDVPCSDPDAPYIKLAYNQGIIAGCTSNPGYNPPVFCPNSNLTRAQAAVFLVKGYENAGFVPGPCQGIFTDVTCTGPYAIFAPYIEELSDDGVTAGCGTGSTFCPGNSVGEWEMLVWLSKGGNGGTPLWALYHPAPRGSTFFYRDAGARLITEAKGGLVGASTASAPVGRDNVFLGDMLVASYISSADYGQTGWQYYFSDHLGSPRKVTNGSGTLVETRKYWPYGEPVFTENSTQSLRFATMERDTEADHSYAHARYHDSVLGRFASADIVDGFESAPQTWNRYTYAVSSPLVYADRDGLISVTVFAAEKGGCKPSAGCYAVEVTAEDPDKSAALSEDMKAFLSQTAANGIVGAAMLGSTARLDSPFGPQRLARYMITAEGQRMGGVRESIANVLADLIPTDATDLALMAAFAELKAVQLIRGSFKKSLSYASELEIYTKKQLEKIAKQGGAKGKKAQDMLKLIKQAKRLAQKEFGRRR